MDHAAYDPRPSTAQETQACQHAFLKATWQAATNTSLHFTVLAVLTAGKEATQMTCQSEGCQATQHPELCNKPELDHSVKQTGATKLISACAM